MGLTLRASVVVPADAPRVFEMVCTPELLPRWNVSVETACRIDPNEPIALGSRAVMTGRLLGQPLESETEVVGFEPPRFFATRAIRGPRLITRFDLEACEQGTRVSVDVSGEVPGGRLGNFVAEGFLRKELTASLDRLRALGEDL